MNVIGVSCHEQEPAHTDDSEQDRAQDRDRQQRGLEQRGHHQVDHHERQRDVDQHRLHGFVVLLGAASELPGVARRQREALHHRLDDLLDLIECRAGSEVARDHHGGQPVDALDGAVAGLDPERRDAAEADGRTVGQRDGQRSEIFDRLSIGRAEQQAHRDLALGGSQLAQTIAAHGGCNSGGDHLRRQAQLRRAVAVDHDVDLLVAAAGLGVHAFEARLIAASCRDTSNDRS